MLDCSSSVKFQADEIRLNKATTWLQSSYLNEWIDKAIFIMELRLITVKQRRDLVKLDSEYA